MKLPPNHISLESEALIKEICRPLFQHSEISYFIFARFYKDGAHICLPSNASWHKHFWDKQYHKNSNDRLSNGFHFWTLNTELNKANLEAKQFFNMDNKLDLVEEFEDYYDVFGFASIGESIKTLDFYLNQQEILRKFSLYFKDQAQELIKTADKKENRLYIAEIKNLHDKNENKIDTNLRIKKFRFGNIILTEKEMKVLSLVIRGRAAVEISQQLNVSPKTIESYVQALKNKFNCLTRAELFDKVFFLGITDFIKEDILDGNI